MRVVAKLTKINVVGSHYSSKVPGCLKMGRAGTIVCTTINAIFWCVGYKVRGFGRILYVAILRQSDIQKSKISKEGGFRTRYAWNRRRNLSFLMF
jgi:hypothetical protein